MIPCTDCTKEISQNALACPHCGAPTEAGKAAANQGSGNAVGQFLGGLFSLAVIAYFAWQFNLFGLGKFKPLPKIDVGNEVSAAGISFRDWQWESTTVIKGRIQTNTLPLAGNSVPYALYAKGNVAIHNFILAFPPIGPGQAAECQITAPPATLSFNGVDRIFIGTIDPQQFPPR
ncbi:MAG: hypothetical protein K2X38_09750 [Gemmataceae bacterium]|nr:hypothetical protein [Gemmataceae bacterium]